MDMDSLLKLHFDFPLHEGWLPNPTLSKGQLHFDK